MVRRRIVAVIILLIIILSLVAYIQHQSQQMTALQQHNKELEFTKIAMKAEIDDLKDRNESLQTSVKNQYEEVREMGEQKQSATQSKVVEPKPNLLQDPVIILGGLAVMANSMKSVLLPLQP